MIKELRFTVTVLPPSTEDISISSVRYLVMKALLNGFPDAWAIIVDHGSIAETRNEVDNDSTPLAIDS